jgi:hypothetical protein
MVEVLSPAPTRVWREVVDSDRSAMAFQTPEWLRAICEAGPFVDASRMYLTADGRRLVLPMVRRRETPGSMAIRLSLPVGWGTGGIVAEHGRLTAADVRAIRADLDRTSVGTTVITPNPAQDHLWRVAGSPWSKTRTRMVQMLDLSDGFDEVWARQFKSSVRRAVRKAEASDLTVERDSGPRLMREFYELYELSVLRWAQQDGVPASVARWRAGRLESLRKFERVAELMGPACVTWVARLDGRAVAGIVVLSQGVMANYWRGAMELEKAGPVRANDLLHRLAIEDACVRGMQRYSFGNSNPGTGLARFKESFGADSIHYAEYITERLPLFKTADTARSLARRGLEKVSRRG